MQARIKVLVGPRHFFKLRIKIHLYVLWVPFYFLVFVGPLFTIFDL